MRQSVYEIVILLIGLMIGGLFAITAAPYVSKKPVSKPIITFTRADDGTPCYTYQDSFICDFNRADRETNMREYPYAVE